MIDFPNPLNSAILHLSLTTHAFGNSLRNNCLLELFVFFNAGTGFGQQIVNLLALQIKKRNNLGLNILRYYGNWQCDEFFF